MVWGAVASFGCTFRREHETTHEHLLARAFDGDVLLRLRRSRESKPL